MTPNELSEYLKVLEQAASPHAQQLYQVIYKQVVTNAAIGGFVSAALLFVAAFLIRAGKRLYAKGEEDAHYESFVGGVVCFAFAAIATLVGFIWGIDSICTLLSPEAAALRSIASMLHP